MTWYERNKDKVTAQKRQQYNQDSDVFKKRNKRYRDNLAGGVFVRTKVVEGQLLYSLSTIASQLQLDPRTIRNWSAKDKVPKAYLVDKTHWYTPQAFIEIKEYATSQDKTTP